MAKKFKSGRCAHCLSFSNKLTSDHVFPKSWYPTTTPPYIEKWQMPSCATCNQKYGVIENELLIRFGLCIDPNEFSSLGISDKAMRALNPLYATNEKDKIARSKRREKIKKEMFKFIPTMNPSTIPGFGIENNPKESQHHAIGVNPDHLIAIGEKIIRGTQYILWKRYVPKDQRIDIFFLMDPHSQPIREAIEKYGAKYHRGPGIDVNIASPKDDLNSALYEIIVWKRLKFYGTILPRGTQSEIH